ncbi:hypothetical protein F2Q70_00034383 [Brassica cretica]|uniref:Uncharacterized protein n=1 Tax=Brassica cretica TaxID=69181 RepID=A0A8S9JZL7_BRACR|nr:hypothetical protein F2Q70_00034383 [Brassica cretica]
MKMKKKKPKKSPPLEDVSEVESDETVLPTFDAVAQLPVSQSDTNSQSEVSPPGTIVIAEQSADPALACNEDLFSQHESSSNGLPPSPSATPPVESEIAEDFISSGTLTIVANADAHVNHLSSQQANVNDLTSVKDQEEVHPRR